MRIVGLGHGLFAIAGAGLHWARSRRGWIWHHDRDSPPLGGHPRSDHDEPVWPSGLGAEPVYAAAARMGNAAQKSMVRTLRDLVVSGLRVDCRNIFAKPPLGLDRKSTRLNSSHVE